MATYTDINGVKLITTGDEAGTWGTSTNTNLQILERAANGYAQIALSGTTYTLTLSNQPSSPEDGHYKAIEFTGSPGGTCTVTLEQNDHARVYMFLNNTDETVTITQGSGGNVSILASDGAIVLADGAGSGAQVKDLTATIQAETATKLATARDFSITGDITAAAVSFDGTGNVALSAAITADSIVDADINSSAAIADTKLATISTASKVANSATTATDANTASAIVARDGSGNFSAGTITAALTGNVTGDLTGNVTGDVTGTIQTAAQPNITSLGTLTTLTVDDITINGSTISDADALTFDIGTDLTIDVDGGDIFLKDGGTQRGSIDVATANTVKHNVWDGAAYSEEVRLTTSGVNVINGLRVGDTTAPTDNDIYAAADIEAANNLIAGNELVMSSGTVNWSFEVDGSNSLVIQYGGITVMKLSTSGNLQVAGDLQSDTSF